MSIIKAPKKRSANASAIGYSVQNQYQILIMLRFELFISKELNWKYVIQEGIEDLDISTNRGTIYIQLKYNQKSQPDSFSRTSDFFKVFDDRKNKKDALSICYICSEPRLLKKFWKKDPNVIHKYYKLLKFPKKVKMDINTYDNIINEYYRDLIDEKITEDDLSYINKFRFMKIIEREDINREINDLMTEMVKKYIKNYKHEEIKSKCSLVLRDLVLKHLNEKKSITREIFLKQIEDIFNLKKNGKTRLSEFMHYTYLDKIRNNDGLIFLSFVINLIAAYKFFKGEYEKKSDKINKSHLHK
uniref:Uncharacterized protein n=1 Tax=Pithovirus LCPAC001 TaxID=2506585 RepID=A0A481Z3N9_9VIRU|nr:MAG: hypothetical protein LCPAC001_01680 [Pithovirus LCPAC001]